MYLNYTPYSYINISLYKIKLSYDQNKNRVVLTLIDYINFNLLIEQGI
jgi:hypothetical protein